jgi:uncharacterized membrane protein YgdD (TMEM256/DUF423 family)
MQSIQRLLRQLWAANGFLAVALGAFGAHGLKARLGSLPDAARRLEWWQTASHYHLFHALALGILASFVGPAPRAIEVVAGAALLVGMLLFSGSLYLMALSGQTDLALLTPLGGLALLFGWAALFVLVSRGGRTPRTGP